MALRPFLLLIFGLCLLTSTAQTCTLGIGGENTETIIEVFQLNETQIATMEVLRGELEIQTENIEKRIEKLWAEHPQSTEEELIRLADKYKALQQEVVDASYESDKKLLSLFNPRQYERYMQLCRAAIRRPIAVVPKVYNDSIAPEQSVPGRP